MNQTGNNFCEGVSIIVDAAVAKIKYDETIIGTITHTNVEGQSNKYRIKSSDMNFVAVAEDAYEVGDQVYVCIQQGDYSLEKRITGKYIAQEAPKNFYTEPADSLLDIVSFQATNLTGSAANNFSLSPSAFGDYDTLGLKFSLNTAEVIELSNYKGNYNIEITFNSNPSLVITVNSNDFHNNPFVMRNDLFEHQALELTTEQIHNIYTANQYTVNITVPGENNPFNKPADMRLTYFAMTFGYNSSQYQIPDNITHPIALTLDSPNTGTSSDFEYTFIQKEASDEYISESTKQMSVDWNASAIDNTFTIYNEDNRYPIEGDYTIYWCKYIKGYQKTEGAGDIDESGTYWKTMQAIDAHSATSYHYTFTPRREENDDSYTREQEQFKVVVKHKDGAYYTSNGITFEHTTYVAPDLDIQFPNQAQVIETLGFKLAEGDDGNYNIYGSNYRVGYAELQQIKPTITAQFLDNTSNDAWLNAEVTWRIPNTASMLLPRPADKAPIPDDPTQSADPTQGWVLDDNEMFWVWTRYGEPAKEIGYTFANYYYPARTHNTIYCNVKITELDENTGVSKDNYYFGSYTFTFGLKNTNGSNYALNIIPLNNEGTPYYGGFPMVTIKQEGNIIQQYSDYKAILEDETGAAMQGYDVIWSWYYGEEPTGLLLSTTGLHNHQCKVSRRYLDGEEKFVELTSQTYACAILQAKIENWEDKNGTKINLIAYYPIGFGPADCDLVGPSHIIYNYQGINPVYDGTPYNIQKTVLGTGGGDIIINIEEADSVTCEICKGIEEHDTVLPATIVGDIIQNTLKPLPVYLTDPAPCYVQCDAVFEDGTQTTWYQPLLVTQDKYASALANAWDTELSIDNANNTILAQTIGAGTKDTDNRYTGVLMGQVKLQDTGATVSSINYGLYGFQEGQCTFNFTDKGTAYIGNSNNYLRFDRSGFNLFLGNGSTFQVGNVNNYMQFTPDQGKFDIHIVNGQFTIGDINKSYIQFKGNDYDINQVTIQTDSFNLNADGLTLRAVDDDKYFLFGQENTFREQQRSYELDNGSLVLLYYAHNGYTVYIAEDNHLCEKDGNYIYNIDDYEVYADPVTLYAYIINNGNKQYINQTGEVVMSAEESYILQPAMTNVIDKRHSHLLFIPEQNGQAAKFKLQIVDGDFILNSPNFTIDESGNVSMKGRIEANSGLIGNWVIGDDIGKQRLAQEWADTMVAQELGWDATKFIEQMLTSSPSSLIAGGPVGQYQIYSLAFDPDPLYQTVFQIFRLYASNSNPDGDMQSQFGFDRDGNIWGKGTCDFGYDAQNYKYSLQVYETGGDLTGSWYLEDSPIETSDQNAKNSITEITDNYSIFFDYLQPVTYKYNHGTSGRLHTGFIAQEVKIALDKAHIGTQDFGGLVIRHPNQTNELWGLRYEEFIALNTNEIQKLKARVNELETLLREKGVIL